MVTKPRRFKKIYATGVQKWQNGDRPSVLSHALAMATQAEQKHGGEVRTWCARRLGDVVWKGEKGMRAVQLPDDGYEVCESKRL